MDEFKGLVNFEGSGTMSNSFVGTAHSDAASSQTYVHVQNFNETNDKRVHQMVGQLEMILNNKDTK